MKIKATYCIALVTALVVGTFADAATSGIRIEKQKENDPVGIYLLTEVNGNPVPTTVSHGGELYVDSGTFIITAEKTCTSIVRFRVPSGEEITKEVEATYTQEDSKLTMQWEGAGKNEGTIDENVFTMYNEGMVFTYIRKSAEHPKESPEES